MLSTENKTFMQHVLDTHRRHTEARHYLSFLLFLLFSSSLLLTKHAYAAGHFYFISSAMNLVPYLFRWNTFLGFASALLFTYFPSSKFEELLYI